LSEVFQLLRAITGARATAYEEPSLMRSADLSYLVGDSTKLRRATGWAPVIELERTLRELVDAQAN
jgi:nucleoside-diphosphate-sugar epimerase